MPEFYNKESSMKMPIAIVFIIAVIFGISQLKKKGGPGLPTWDIDVTINSNNNSNNSQTLDHNRTATTAFIEQQSVQVVQPPPDTSVVISITGTEPTDVEANMQQPQPSLDSAVSTGADQEHAPESTATEESSG